MNNRVVLGVLSVIFGGILIVRIGALAFDVYMNFFSNGPITSVDYYEDDFGDSTFVTSKFGSSLEENGYAISIRFNLTLADSIVQAKGSGYKHLNEDEQKKINPDVVRWKSLRWPFNQYKSQFDRYAEQLDTIYRVDTIVNHLVVRPPWPDSLDRDDTHSVNYTFKGGKPPIDWIANSTIGGSSIIRILPKTEHQKLMLLLRHYLLNLLITIIVYQFFRVVLILKNKVSFTQNLVKRTFYIAIWCLIYALGMYLVDKEIASWFIGIWKRTSATFSNPLEIVQYSIYPIVIVKFNYLFVGLLLLVLSTLFKRSADIENELGSIV